MRVARRRLQEIHGAAFPSHLIPNPRRAHHRGRDLPRAPAPRPRRPSRRTLGRFTRANRKAGHESAPRPRRSRLPWATRPCSRLPAASWPRRSRPAPAWLSKFAHVRQHHARIVRGFARRAGRRLSPFRHGPSAGRRRRAQGSTRSCQNEHLVVTSTSATTGARMHGERRQGSGRDRYRNILTPPRAPPGAHQHQLAAAVEHQVVRG